MQFNPMHFIDNLYYMGIGMAGIFIVIGLIILITVLLNKITAKKKKTSGEDLQNKKNKTK